MGIEFHGGFKRCDVEIPRSQDFVNFKGIQFRTYLQANRGCDENGIEFQFRSNNS